MGFPVQTIKERQQEHAVRGRYHRAAVGCWFTSTGRTLPMLVKYEGPDGLLHTIKNFQIQKTEQKYYAGILCRRYDCSADMNGQTFHFILLYHPETAMWDLVLSQ